MTIVVSAGASTGPPTSPTPMAPNAGVNADLRPDHPNVGVDRVMASDLVATLVLGDGDGDGGGTELVNLRNARDLARASYCAEQMIHDDRADSTIKSYDQKIQ